MKKIITLIVLSLLLAVPFDAAARKTTRKEDKARLKTEKTQNKRKHSSHGKREFSVSWTINQIVNYTSIPVVYKYGEDASVVVDGPEDLIYFVSLNVSQRSVIIKASENGPHNFNGVVVTVTADNIGNLINYGSGSISAERIDTNGATLQNFGSGNISVKSLDCTKLQVNLYGSGSITSDNVDCTSLTVLCKSSGTVSFKSADTTSVDLVLQGSGQISIPNIDGTSLRATNSGSGDINIAGDVTSAVLVVRGSGNIKTKGLDSVRTTINEIRGSGSISD